MVRTVARHWAAWVRNRTPSQGSTHAATSPAGMAGVQNHLPSSRTPVWSKGENLE